MPSVTPWLSLALLVVAGIRAIQSTREYGRKSRQMDEEFAAWMDKLAELEKLPPDPRSLMFRRNPALGRAVEEQLTDLAARAKSDRQARLALEQLVADELVVLDQLEEELRELPDPTEADREELAAIPAHRAALTAHLRP